MRKITLLTFALLLFVYRSSDAGLFDFNPEGNFNNADYLMSHDRSLAADKLINDVIKFCLKNNDEACLAKAYYYYGKLLMYRVGPTTKFYKIMSYVDQSITTDNVYQKSMEYLNRALELSKKHELNDTISTIYIKIAFLQFERFKDQTSACDNLDQSLRYHLIWQKDNPDKKVILPEGFKNFEEYIAQAKKEMGCQ